MKTGNPGVWIPYDEKILTWLVFDPNSVDHSENIV
jgi:hypothetical protein